MSTYKYTFKRNNEVITSFGVNLIDGAKNAGLTITRVDKLPSYYLKETKFDDRVRNAWCVKHDEMYSNGFGDLYEVSQKRNF